MQHVGLGPFAETLVSGTVGKQCWEFKGLIVQAAGLHLILGSPEEDLQSNGMTSKKRETPFGAFALRSGCADAVVPWRKPTCGRDRCQAGGIWPGS